MRPSEVVERRDCPGNDKSPHMPPIEEKTVTGMIATRAPFALRLEHMFFIIDTGSTMPDRGKVSPCILCGLMAIDGVDPTLN